MRNYTSLALLAIVLLISACGKRNGDSEVNVKMIDAPAVFSEVNVEITKV